MKINFTKKEYSLLLDMLYLSDWMINSHIDDIEKDGNPEYKALRKNLMSHYKEMGAEDLVNYDNKYDDYYASSEHEESLHKQFIDPYNDETFWDELMERLAVRDLVKQFDEEKIRTMGYIKRSTLIDELREPYVDEFETHGVEHLQIQKI